MDVLLDSNLIIYAAQPDDRVGVPFIAAGPCVLASEISIVESIGFRGLDLRERTAIEQILARTLLLSVDRDVIDQAVLLRQHRRMSLGDAIVAATALEHDLTLATRNIGDFADIDGLIIVNPFDYP